jgi:excisionase family DNA binding protein
MPEKLYSPEEVAEYLGLSPITIRHYLRTGTMQGVQVGHQWRVKESALEAYVAEQEKITRDRAKK